MCCLTVWEVRGLTGSPGVFLLEEKLPSFHGRPLLLVPVPFPPSAKPAQRVESFSRRVTLPSSSAPSTFKDPREYARPTQIIQDNLAFLTLAG